MTVTFLGSVQDYSGGVKSLELGGARDIQALIERLGERFGGEFREFLLGDETCFFLVNGSGILATGGLSTPLRDADTVDVLPFVDGG